MNWVFGNFLFLEVFYELCELYYQYFYFTLFYFQICDLAEVAIIHKMFLPDLATSNYECFFKKNLMKSFYIFCYLLDLTIKSGY